MSDEQKNTGLPEPDPKTVEALAGDVLDLSGEDFSGHVLKDTGFPKANFRFCSFRQTVLENLDLSNASLHGADFTDATLTNVQLEGASLKGAVFVNARLSNVNLNRTDLRSVTFEGATFKNVSREEAQTRGTLFPRGVTDSPVSSPVAEDQTSEADLHLLKEEEPSGDL